MSVKNIMNKNDHPYPIKVLCDNPPDYLRKRGVTCLITRADVELDIEPIAKLFAIIFGEEMMAAAMEDKKKKGKA